MTTLRHLKIFAAVCDERSMTAAARRLFMTQPSVSQAIKELEREYGVILFERLARKLYVTEPGEAMYRYARHIIKLCEEMEDSLRQSSRQQRLKVGANYSVGAALIHNYVRAFEKLHPDAEISVTVNKSSVLVDMLRKNELDLALMEEVQDIPDLVEEFFYDDRIVVVAAPDHPFAISGKASADGIARERLLLREKGVGVRNLFELRMNELGLRIEPYWESTSTMALINAAENCLGIAVVPLLLVDKRLAEGNLVEIKPPGLDLSRKLVIAYHKNKYLTPAMHDLMAICRGQK